MKEEQLIRKIRERLTICQDPDDIDAMGIILDCILEEADMRMAEMKELELLAEKIFLKTRRSLGILTPLVEDSEITEIMVNGPDKIFYEKEGNILRASMCFDSEEELEEIMQRIMSEVHREINELNPIADARLPDGSRVNGVFRNISVSGSTLTIRKFSDNYMELEDLTANGTMTPDTALLLEALTFCGYNLFVSGGTSSGKTTLLNALGGCIDPSESVIVIEDSAELKLNHSENLVHMECRQDNRMGRGGVTMAGLIKSSLRMRPDRIIVGEVRGEEVVDMLQAMNTGHAGSMSTGHGNSVKGMLKRLESMYLMAVPLEIDAIRAQIAEGIDIMIHVEKISYGRRVMSVSELLGYEEGEFLLNELIAFVGKDTAIATGSFMRNTDRLFRKGEKYIDRLQHMGFVSI